MSLPGGMQIDVDSANTLPSGVTTFRFRSLMQNPIDRSHFWTYMAKAIDCKTVETVNLTKGTREPFSPWQGEFTMKTPFSAIGYRLFC